MKTQAEYTEDFLDAVRQLKGIALDTEMPTNEWRNQAWEVCRRGFILYILFGIDLNIIYRLIDEVVIP